MATALFNRKTLARRVALAGAPDPVRVAALKAWADSIASGRVASLKETALHGPFMQLMIDGWLAEIRPEIAVLSAEIARLDPPPRIASASVRQTAACRSR